MKDRVKWTLKEDINEGMREGIYRKLKTISGEK